MLEVRGTLLTGNVHIAGDWLHCCVTVRNLGQDTFSDGAGSNDDDDEAPAPIGDCLVFLECVGSLPRNGRSLVKLEHLADSKKTLSDRRPKSSAFLVQKTRPDYLFMRQTVAVGVVKTFYYRSVVPFEFLPCFPGGRAVKFMSRLIVTFTYDDRLIVLKLPFRVVTIGGLFQRLNALLSNPSYDEDEAFERTDGRRLEAGVDRLNLATMANPFVDSGRMENGDGDDDDDDERMDGASPEPPFNKAVNELLALTNRRTRNVFRISSGADRGCVCFVKLPKLQYRLGEEICGLMDFSQATINCLEVNIQLVWQELLNYDVADMNECAKLAVVELDADDSSADGRQEKARYVLVQQQTVSTFQEASLFCANLTFSLAVPVNATQTFANSYTRCRWLIQFEFSTVAGKDSNGRRRPVDAGRPVDGSHDVAPSFSAPSSLPVEVFCWPLNILVQPDLPHLLQSVPHPRLEEVVRA